MNKIPLAPPEEILLKIFNFFTAKELVRSVRPVCSQWKRLSEDNYLWKNLVLEDFGISRDSEQAVGMAVDSESDYQRYQQLFKIVKANETIDVGVIGSNDYTFNALFDGIRLLSPKNQSLQQAEFETTQLSYFKINMWRGVWRWMRERSTMNLHLVLICPRNLQDLRGWIDESLTSLRSGWNNVLERKKNVKFTKGKRVILLAKDHSQFEDIKQLALANEADIIELPTLLDQKDKDSILYILKELSKIRLLKIVATRESHELPVTAPKQINQSSPLKVPAKQDLGEMRTSMSINRKGIALNALKAKQQLSRIGNSGHASANYRESTELSLDARLRWSNAVCNASDRLKTDGSPRFSQRNLTCSFYSLPRHHEPASNPESLVASTFMALVATGGILLVLVLAVYAYKKCFSRQREDENPQEEIAPDDIMPHP